MKEGKSLVRVGNEKEEGRQKKREMGAKFEKLKGWGKKNRRYSKAHNDTRELIQRQERNDRSHTLPPLPLFHARSRGQATQRRASLGCPSCSATRCSAPNSPPQRSTDSVARDNDQNLLHKQPHNRKNKEKVRNEKNLREDWMSTTKKSEYRVE